MYKVVAIQKQRVYLEIDTFANHCKDTHSTLNKLQEETNLTFPIKAYDVFKCAWIGYYEHSASQQQRNTSKNFKTFVSMLPTDLQSTTGKQKK